MAFFTRIKPNGSRSIKKGNVARTAAVAGAAGLGTWALIDPSGAGSTVGETVGGLLGGLGGGFMNGLLSPGTAVASGSCCCLLSSGLIAFLMIR